MSLTLLLFFVELAMFTRADISVSPRALNPGLITAMVFLGVAAPTLLHAWCNALRNSAVFPIIRSGLAALLDCDRNLVNDCDRNA